MSMLLSLDQATHNTGYAIFEDGNLLTYGVIQAEGKDCTDRIMNTCDKVADMVLMYGIEEAVIEGIEYRNNMKTYAQLANLQGALFRVFHESRIGVDVLSPATWRSAVGIHPAKKREVQKQAAMDLVHDMLGRAVSDDEADAILQGVGHIKHKENNGK